MFQSNKTKFEGSGLWWETKPENVAPNYGSCGPSCKTQNDGRVSMKFISWSHSAAPDSHLRLSKFGDVESRESIDLKNVFALHFRFNVAMTGMAVQVRLPFGSLQISFKGRPSAVPCAGLNVESSILDLNHWPENQTKDVERHEVIRFDVISVESFNCIQLQLLARAKAQRLTVSHTSLFNSQHKYPEISRNAEKKIKKGVIFLFFDSFCFSHPMAFLVAAESCAQVRDSLNKPRLGVTLRPRRPSETQ